LNQPFSSWRAGIVLYLPWLVVGAFCAWPAWPLPVNVLGALFLVLGIATLLFFRDPPRRIPSDPSVLVAPADGRIVAVEDLADAPYYDGACRRVSIFLSLFNVHINRAPCAAEVIRVDFRPGSFLNAMRADSSEENESNTLRLATPCGPVTVRQVSGLIARTIVCRAAPGDLLTKGEKFGMIKFGSRTELYLPEGTEVCVAERENVRAGASVIARFHDAHPHEAQE
jgi:phosphatidylserine decarboxylase